MGIESPVHLLFVAVVALIVLGPKRLPGLAKALGQGIREFRQSLDDGAGAGEQYAPPAASTVSAPAASSATPSPSPPPPDAADATADVSQPHTADSTASATPASAPGRHAGEQ